MDQDDGSTHGGRSRRQKIDKTGRTAALEKFRQLKGNKNKYEVDGIKEVWKEVDEREYSKMVRDRQDDDWIVDDNGQGYVEDGREIFDDDDNDGDLPKTNKRSDVGNKRGGNKNDVAIVGPTAIKNKNLKSMFMSMPTKRKKAESNVDVNDDNLLNNILHEMSSAPSTPNTPSPIFKPVLKKKINTPIVTSMKKSPQINSTISNGSGSSHTPTRQTQKKPLRPRIVAYDDQDITSSMEFNTEEVNNIKQEHSETIKSNFKDNNSTENFLDSAIMAELDDIDVMMEVETMEDKNSLTNNRCKVEVKNMNESNGLHSTPKSSVAVETVYSQQIDENFDNNQSSNWDEMCLQYSTPKAKDSDSIMSSVEAPVPLYFPSSKPEDGENIIKFFWIDAYEDFFKQPGVVYLFGKIWIEDQKNFVSCCVTVRNIERTIYLLPREQRHGGSAAGDPVTFIDVHKELSSLLTEKYKIFQFRAKKTSRKYCFDKMDVPAEAEYLEAKYSAIYSALPSDLTGETFSHIFGSNTSSLEQLLLDQKIKGPCWLEIKSPISSGPPISWCKVEFSVDKPENIVPIKSEMKIPPVTIMAFSLKTAVNSATHQNEIVAFSCMVRQNYYLDKPTSVPPFQEHFCAVTKLSNSVFPFDFVKRIENQNRFKIMKFDSERAMLNYILVKFFNFDPDVIVVSTGLLQVFIKSLMHFIVMKGHDIVSFDYGVLLNHLHANKIPNWSRLGKLRKSIMPKFSSGLRIGEIACGRLVCDVKIMAKELVRSKSYDLSALAKLILKKDRVDMDVNLAFRSSQCLFNLVEWSLLDVNYCLHIMYELNILPLALQITTIAGNLLSRTLLGGRSERNEYLLLHAFTEKGYIVPDKIQFKANNHKRNMNATVDDGIDVDKLDEHESKPNKGRKKAAYTGGLVLEPKRGFYDQFILLMDFNSLYPSIIQEYNVCFTGMRRDPGSENQDDNVFVPDDSSSPGILPLEIRRLVESRRQVKNLLKDSNLSNDLKTQYDIRQKALKLTANSMYGCLGFANSRFYAKPLAAFVTTKGREILLQTKNLVQSINLEVIYGDTDSIMINTNCTDVDTVMKLGNKIKKDVNKLYRHLEIEVDGIFKSMLLLKKKKYAALAIQKLPNGSIITTEEIKGVDIVRRDWSGLACDAGKFVIREILSDKQRDQILDEIQSYLCDLKDRIINERIDLQKWTITKQLTKNPEDYNDKKSLPHVNVAVRLNSKGGKQLKQGDTVAYVICEDGSNLPATQRAYHLDELKNNSLKIDKNYYLSQQVHPVIARLCDPIEGMDGARIADALGLDATAYRSTNINISQKDGEEEAMLGNRDVSPKERFSDYEPFVFYCSSSTCKHKIVMDSPFVGKGVEIQLFFSRCPNPKCKNSPELYINSIHCHLVKSIRQFIQKYYLCWMKCDDPMCSTRTRKLPLRFEHNQPLCSVCGKGHLQLEYTEAQLYNQLLYYLYIFDVTKVSKTMLNYEEKAIIRSEMTRLLPIYNRLKKVVSGYLDSSDYAVVNLSQLLEGLPFDNLPFPGKRSGELTSSTL
ncbi:DNA polymerase alpha catalytic subunit [Chamberlinius hualienensis]